MSRSQPPSEAEPVSGFLSDEDALACPRYPNRYRRFLDAILGVVGRSGVLKGSACVGLPLPAGVGIMDSQ